MLLSVCIVLTCASLSQAGIMMSPPKGSCQSGENFEADPDDCFKYLVCEVNTGDFTVMACAFPLVWEQQVMSCKGLGDRGAKCKIDVCMNQKDDTTRAAEGHCRGYWKCTQGKSVPTCCDYGFRYNASTANCENITSDTMPNECHTCLDARAPNETKANVTKEDKPCDRGVVSNDPSKFTVSVQGFDAPTEMSCSTGTEFDVKICDCVLTSGRVQKTCEPDLHLPFTNDTNDDSNVQSTISATNVVVNNGVAKFDGATSVLDIERYANVDHTSAMVIELIYSPDQVTGNQSLVSNGNCPGHQPSVVITDDGPNVIFTVGTIDENHKNFTLTTVTVPKPANSQPSIAIRLEFLQGSLTGTVNGDSLSEIVAGYLNNVHCALSIGKSFAGEIDDLKIYLCKPTPKVGPK